MDIGDLEHCEFQSRARKVVVHYSIKHFNMITVSDIHMRFHLPLVEGALWDETADFLNIPLFLHNIVQQN